MKTTRPLEPPPKENLPPPQGKLPTSPRPMRPKDANAHQRENWWDEVKMVYAAGPPGEGKALVDLAKGLTTMKEKRTTTENVSTRPFVGHLMQRHEKQQQPTRRPKPTPPVILDPRRQQAEVERVALALAQQEEERRRQMKALCPPQRLQEPPRVDSAQSHVNRNVSNSLPIPVSHNEPPKPSLGSRREVKMIPLGGLNLHKAGQTFKEWRTDTHHEKIKKKISVPYPMSTAIGDSANVALHCGGVGGTAAKISADPRPERPDKQRRPSFVHEIGRRLTGREPKPRSPSVSVSYNGERRGTQWDDFVHPREPARLHPASTVPAAPTGIQHPCSTYPAAPAGEPQQYGKWSVYQQPRKPPVIPGKPPVTPKPPVDTKPADSPQPPVKPVHARKVTMPKIPLLRRVDSDESFTCIGINPDSPIYDMPLRKEAQESKPTPPGMYNKFRELAPIYAEFELAALLPDLVTKSIMSMSDADEDVDATDAPPPVSRAVSEVEPEDKPRCMEVHNTPDERSPMHSSRTATTASDYDKKLYEEKLRQWWKGNEFDGDDRKLSRAVYRESLKQREPSYVPARANW
ncbi:hypothetical protein W97_08522 [Coniosporium apollinis CBS 100218]|uniref:Uncharacterized protein n=1 Tax=Coniosporium apollinis (strain CBS 100218) TaxID=1168221 RepID=R7Z586_CONA1|nr:uncharacterized protein W97_08522 [Coniosporium apollinis CBS 100218]EON69164.1 hypothetical protein W97_08522 [Coniosporium apollinis CBS 100218]